MDSERFAFRAVAPRPFIINALPCVFSSSTKGLVTGPAVRFDVDSFADLEPLAGKLKGAFLLMDPALPTPAHFEPQARRFTDAELDAMAAGQWPARTPREVVEIRYNVMDDPRARRWLANEEVAVLLFTGPGDGGTIFEVGKSAPDEIPAVKVSAESYGRILRILEKNIPVVTEDSNSVYLPSPILPTGSVH